MRKEKYSVATRFICIIFLLFAAEAAYAIKPYFNQYGMLVLRAETCHGQMNTGYLAVCMGVETWLYKYYWIINSFCFGNPNYTYYDYLPGYGFTQVTAEKLAMAIYTDAALGLGRVPTLNYNMIKWGLQKDHDLNKLAVTYSYDWDPYTYWKWRSVYMETGYIENSSVTVQPGAALPNNQRRINANCWGTADYLAKDAEWKQKYQADFPNGASTWETKFPHVYLDGGKYYYWGQYNEFCLDDDLGPQVNYRADFVGYGQNVASRNTVNSFDVIRLAATPSGHIPPYSYEMVVGSVNVGENLHGVAYLTTDNAYNAWYYEKHNYGAALYNPYGVGAFPIWGHFFQNKY
jgi:hypothetical protein